MYQSNSTVDDATKRLVEQQRTAIWNRHPEWSEAQKRELWQRQRQQLATYLMNDEARPRTVRQEQVFPSGGASTARSRTSAVDIPSMRKRPFDANCASDVNPTPKSQTAPCQSTLSKAHPAAMYWSNCFNFDQTLSQDWYGELDGSIDYTLASANAQQPHEMAGTSIENFSVFDPVDFVSKASTPTLSHSASKRQRVDGDAPRCQSSQASLVHNSCVQSSLPTLTPCTSVSSGLTPGSTPISVDMSRQSSVNGSILGAFDMMRVESSFSTASADLFPFPFPFEDDSNMTESLVSCSTTKPSSSDTTSFDESKDACLLSNMGYGSQDLSFSSSFQSAAAVPLRGRAYQLSQSSMPTAESMQRSTSGSSSSSNSSAEVKTSRRRQRHIQNSQQSIAPKSSPDGVLKFQYGDVNTKEARLSSSQDPTAMCKQAITKQHYVRPQHPKLICEHCNDYPDGFRGDHELRRHYDRAHANKRKVWVCTEPSERTEYWPSKPLGICKQCKQQKEYNVYYNAAAHLRRAHFNPRKRGRKARGEEREKRAGKAGGDWPPIDWLKTHGWLKQIEVYGSQGGSDGEEDEDESSDTFAAIAHKWEAPSTTDYPPQPDSAIDLRENYIMLENLGFGVYPFASYELGFELGGGAYSMPMAPA